MEQALQLEPTNTAFLIQAGIVKLRLGAIERAREAFTSALRLKPKPYRVREVLDTLETQGLPAPLLDVYTLGCEALDIPDLGYARHRRHGSGVVADQALIAASMWRAAVYNHAWSKDSRDRCRALGDGDAGGGPGAGAGAAAGCRDRQRRRPVRGVCWPWPCR